MNLIGAVRMSINRQIKRIVRLAHTLRYLRPVQWRGQIVERLPLVKERRLKTVLSKNPSTFPGLSGGQRDSSIPSFVRSDAHATVREAGKFCFINQPKELGWPPNWDPDAEKLWVYQLHYFEWIHGLAFQDAKSVVLDWIEKNPPSVEVSSWEPFPVSIRLGEWLAYFFSEHWEVTRQDSEFVDCLWESMWRQCEWLSRNLETRLLGNHYLENGVALYTVGSWFAGEAAARWRRLGKMVVESEFREQFLNDGAHFERSPMYHLRAYELLLRCRAVADEETIEWMDALLRKANAVAHRVTGPDGEIALFNDAATDMYPRLNVLANAYAVQGLEELAQGDIGAWALESAGYYGWRDRLGNYIAIDAGIPGPDYIPGHAHADIFSFVLYALGTPIIVDTGVGSYRNDERRAWDRSTAAHNTLTWNDENQSDVWGAFRLGRRARPRVESWRENDQGFELSAWHAGYSRGNRVRKHWRRFRWDKNDSRLLIEDHFSGAGDGAVTSRLYFAPECEVELMAHTLSVRSGAVMVSIVLNGYASGRVGETTICRRFGVLESARFFEGELAHPEEGAALEMSWAGERSE